MTAEVSASRRQTEAFLIYKSENSPEKASGEFVLVYVAKIF